MYEIVIHENAEEELNAAALYYESREVGLGEAFLNELTHSLYRIRERPFSYAKVFDEYFRCLMTRFPYSVVYRIEAGKILVFAVAHGRRRPGYWRGRLKSSESTL